MLKPNQTNISPGPFLLYLFFLIFVHHDIPFELHAVGSFFDNFLATVGIFAEEDRGGGGRRPFGRG